MDFQEPPAPLPPEPAPRPQPPPTPPPAAAAAIICPACRAAVPATDFFCPNCGSQLREPPLQISISKQIGIYSVALFLPPFGLWYVWKYLRSNDRRAKKIGWIALILTVVAIVVAVWSTIAITNSLNQAVNQSLGSLGSGGLGNLGGLGGL